MTVLMHKLRARLEKIFDVTFPGSQTYWDRRYTFGGNSGSGSYGRLAKYKAEVLNTFVAEQGIKRVLELGCGDGHQLTLAEYPNYFGIDVSPHAVKMCRERFANDPTKKFAIRLPSAERKEGFDLTLSLDVIYHLVEDNVFHNYMSDLFESSRRWVIIYSSNLSMEDFKEQFPSVIDPHVRHRCFTDWVESNRPDWDLKFQYSNPFNFDPNFPTGTSFADMYIFEFCPSSSTV